MSMQRAAVKAPDNAPGRVKDDSDSGGPSVPERLYSTYQVADLLGTTPATVVDWMQKGLLSYSRMADGPVRVSEKGLIRFLKGRGVNIEDVLSLPDDSLVSEEFSPTSDHVSASAAERAARTALLDESPEMGGGEMTAEVAEIAELAEVVEDAERADAGVEPAKNFFVRRFCPKSDQDG